MDLIATIEAISLFLLRAGEPLASDEDVYNAARQANIHGFIAQLPDKYQTILSASSTQLSGGQRQRSVTEDREIIMVGD